MPPTSLNRSLDINERNLNHSFTERSELAKKLKQSAVWILGRKGREEKKMLKRMPSAAILQQFLPSPIRLPLRHIAVQRFLCGDESGEGKEKKRMEKLYLLTEMKDLLHALVVDGAERRVLCLPVSVSISALTRFFNRGLWCGEEGL